MERAPQRVVAGVLCQPVGSNRTTPDAMHDGGVAWAAQLLPGRRMCVPIRPQADKEVEAEHYRLRRLIEESSKKRK